LPEIGYSSLLCNGCWHCIPVCEVHAISIKDNSVNINRKTCTGCGKCVEACTPKALKFYGKEMTVEEVLQEVIRDKQFYQNSGGGVTASGGEALSQADFVAELFKQCQDAYIHTCLDTCGYADTDAWQKVLPHTDLILYDLKLIDPVAHKKFTGKSNHNILQNLEMVAGSGVPVIIRIPLIPTINSSVENITATAKYVAGLKTIKEINLLPYHRFGMGKYTMLDRKYKLPELSPLESLQLEELTAIVESFGIECKIVI
jgi:pyruvate formate lyase activating enzyme